MAIALISGSGFYSLKELENAQEQSIETPFGEVGVQSGRWYGREIVFLARHGAGHSKLSHMIDARAHISACKALGVEAIVGCSIVGVVDPHLPLGQLLLPTELYFPDNRLADGSPCTIFGQAGEPGRGHLIAASFFNAALGAQLQAATSAAELPLTAGLTYGQVQGPRFNSRSEIRALASAGVQIISQTLGPEAVLAGELELPYAALCFGVDYANGVQAEPTPIATLEANMKLSKGRLLDALARLLQNWQPVTFDAFVYRFD